MTYSPSVCFLPAGIDACAYWRMWLPHLNIAGSRFSFTQGMPPMNDIAECDVVVVQRMMTDANLPLLKMIREFGIKIIFDLDDNMWKVPKFNPAFQKLNSKEAHRGIEACAEWADAITVSTQHLATAVGRELGWLKNVATKKTIPIKVIENCVDLKIFEPPLWERNKDEDKVVIGWGGSNTHHGDLLNVWNLLPEVLEKYSNVFLEFVGQEPPEKIRNHERVRVREWCHISEFGKRYATWNWDIVLAPLEENQFNKSKSNIKMQEAGAIQKPCLAQNVFPYQNFCAPMPKLKWQLCYTYDWKTKLEALIESRSMREDYGALMYENVKENFNIERTVPLWKDTISEAFLA